MDRCLTCARNNAMSLIVQVFGRRQSRINLHGRAAGVGKAPRQMLWGERRGQWHHRRSSESGSPACACSDFRAQTLSIGEGCRARRRIKEYQETRRLLTNGPCLSLVYEESHSKRTSTRQQLDCAKTCLIAKKSCFGTSPSQAPKSRPLVKAAPFPIAATTALAVKAPINGCRNLLGSGDPMNRKIDTSRACRVLESWKAVATWSCWNRQGRPCGEVLALPRSGFLAVCRQARSRGH